MARPVRPPNAARTKSKRVTISSPIQADVHEQLSDRHATASRAAPSPQALASLSEPDHVTQHGSVTIADSRYSRAELFCPEDILPGSRLAGGSAIENGCQGGAPDARRHGGTRPRERFNAFAQTRQRLAKF